ncbi:MAG: HPF/RaiA family ribosome-associated protein [Dissulfurispiraceae bacterium]|jgi:cold shock CspA family protein/ribosome-associated translation inhibitor RaiA
MEMPLQITIRNLELSELTKDDLKRRAEKLDTFYPRIMRCRVTVEIPHRYKKQAMNAVEYNISIDLTVPGKEIVIKNRPNKDLDIGIREAFDAAQRKLEDYATKLRGDVKHHETPPHGVVMSIFPDEGYGFLSAEDGHAIYFHENSVLEKNFKRLKAGSFVRYKEEMGEKGPQASTVVLETP